MDKKTCDLCESVLGEARIPNDRKLAYNFFASCGDEPINFGYSTVGRSLKLANCWIGLPFYFQYDSLKDVKTEEIAVFLDDSVPWTSKNGKKLIDSLVLSENAKKFAIMRQIYFADSHGLTFHSMNLILTFGVYRAMSKYISSKLKHKQVVPIVPMAIAKLIQVVACASIFFFVRNIIRHGLDAASDLRSLEHGDEYYEGAIEFYSKTIQRNKAFAFFLGNEGKNYFTPAGDPRPPLYHALFKPNPIPPNERLRIIQDRFGHFIAKDEPISQDAK